MPTRSGADLADQTSQWYFSPHHRQHVQCFIPAGQGADQQQEGDRTSTAKEANTLSKRLEFVPAHLQSELRVEDCREGR